jgi:hypothetical protein
MALAATALAIIAAGAVLVWSQGWAALSPSHAASWFNGHQIRSGAFDEWSAEFAANVSFPPNFARAGSEGGRGARSGL